MIRLRIFAAALAALALLAVAAASASPRTSRLDIPADIPDEVRGAIEDLYTLDKGALKEAIGRIGKMGSRAVRATPFLAEMLGDEYGIFVREPGGTSVVKTIGRFSAEALAAMGDGSVDALASSLKSGGRHERLNAVWALGELKAQRAAGAVIAALDDRYWDVRGEASLALGKIKDPASLEALVRALKGRNYHMRAGAAWSLGEIGDPRAIEPLVEALGDRAGEVREPAAEALFKITGRDLGQNPDAWRKWLEENR